MVKTPTPRNKNHTDHTDRPADHNVSVSSPSKITVKLFTIH